MQTHAQGCSEGSAEVPIEADSVLQLTGASCSQRGRRSEHLSTAADTGAQ